MIRMRFDPIEWLVRLMVLALGLGFMFKGLWGISKALLVVMHAQALPLIFSGAWAFFMWFIVFAIGLLIVFWALQVS